MHGWLPQCQCTLLIFMCSAVCVVCAVCCSYLAFLDLRLVGGRNQYEGRVEVYRYGRKWHSVCDTSWDIADAEVVCRQLGYGYAILAMHSSAFGGGSGGQWEREWHCKGSEISLQECHSRSISCSPTEHASVICSDTGKTKCLSCLAPHTTPRGNIACSNCDCVVTHLIPPTCACSPEQWCSEDGEYRENSIRRSPGVLLQ